MDKDDQDDKVPTVLWAYRIAYKRATNQTPFKLVYGKEVVVPLHFRKHTPEIAETIKIDMSKAKNEKIFKLQKLEEDIIMAIQYQAAQKQQQKAWHDRNIETKNISVGNLVLLYKNRIKGKPHKLETTWMGLYILEDLNSNRSV